MNSNPEKRRRATTVSTLTGQTITTRPARFAEGSIPPPLPGLPPVWQKRARSAAGKRRGPPPIPPEARDRTRYRARTVAWFREGEALAGSGGATSIIDYTAEVPFVSGNSGARAVAICLLGLLIAAVAIFAL